MAESSGSIGILEHLTQSKRALRKLYPICTIFYQEFCRRDIIKETLSIMEGKALLSASRPTF